MTLGVAMLDLTGIDLSIILSEIIALVPVILPVTIGFIAFRKGYSFVVNALRSA